MVLIWLLGCGIRCVLKTTDGHAGLIRQCCTGQAKSENHISKTYTSWLYLLFGFFIGEDLRHAAVFADYAAVAVWVGVGDFDVVE